jgi:hypothetical protein
MTTKLRLTGRQHGQLERHLFPGDGKEAVAIVMCGRLNGSDVNGLLAHEIFCVPHDSCRRSATAISWQPDCILPLLKRAARTNSAIVKIHSHPGGHTEFSETDNRSDQDFFSSIYGWTDTDDVHASAVMLPGGRIFARAIDVQGGYAPVDLVAVAGTDLHFWPDGSEHSSELGFAKRHAQLFGSETLSRLRRLSIAVVGCSGTGSPLIEMLARLGVGRLVLVDPDRVEDKNLNRIYNATREDAVLSRLKSEVMGRAIARMGLGTEVQLVSLDLATPQAVRAVAQCDLAFGCMDGARGRSLLNRLATYYCIPYFDLGVQLEADGEGGISEAIGAVHYLQPDCSSLRDRHVFSAEQMDSESLRHYDRASYEWHVRARYIRGVREDRPAVISVNTQMAATAVNEFLARLHPYRYSSNAEFDTVRVSFIQGEQYHEVDRLAYTPFSKYVGLGDCDPLLGVPKLGE